jgi:hypothetical protein
MIFVFMIHEEIVLGSDSNKEDFFQFMKKVFFIMQISLNMTCCCQGIYDILQTLNSKYEKRLFACKASFIVFCDGKSITNKILLDKKLKKFLDERI